MKKIILIGLVLSVIFSCAEETKQDLRFILVRHAEKDLNDAGEDPELTEQGSLRAMKLNQILDTIAFDGILSTKYKRNIATVTSIAQKNNSAIEIYEWYEWEPMLDSLLKISEGTWLICGHGDNLIPMAKKLVDTFTYDTLSHNEYNKLFEITINNQLKSNKGSQSQKQIIVHDFEP